MSKTVPTSVKDAIKAFETAKSVVAAEAEKARAERAAPHFRAVFVDRAPPWRSQVELWGKVPPIEKMDASLGALKKCKCVQRSAGAAAQRSATRSVRSARRSRLLCRPGAQAPGAEHQPDQQDLKPGGHGLVRAPRAPLQLEL